MRLNKKQNLRLLRSCAQVKIIDLTERESRYHQKQIDLLSKDPDLRLFIEGVYKTNQIAVNQNPEQQPTLETLATMDLQDFNNYQPDEKLLDSFKTYRFNHSQMQDLKGALDKYRTLTDMLTVPYNQKVDPTKVKAFLDEEIAANKALPEEEQGGTEKKGYVDYKQSFARFAKGVKTHTPMHLGFFYKNLADKIAERNNIANKEYYINSDKSFRARTVNLALKHDFQGRFTSKVRKLIIGAALAASLIGGVVAYNHFSTTKSVDYTPGITNNFGSDIETTPSVTPVEISDKKDDGAIFRNSITDISTYDDACKDYFEKISDIYKYNTGEEINLSGYKQENIGYSRGASVFLVELDGKSYTISAQGDTAPNYRYLQEALEATGAKVTQSSTDLSCIIDKNNPDKSLAIVDGQGNAVRSGKVLVGSNNAYNPDYVNSGRKILEAQGRTNCSEAECVGAYLLSDEHAPNEKLAKALGEVDDLTYFIKTYFYYRDGNSDKYTVALYSNRSQKLAQSFEEKAKDNVEQTNQTTTFVSRDDESR